MANGTFHRDVLSINNDFPTGAGFRGFHNHDTDVRTLLHRGNFDGVGTTSTTGITSTRDGHRIVWVHCRSSHPGQQFLTDIHYPGYRTLSTIIRVGVILPTPSRCVRYARYKRARRHPSPSTVDTGGRTRSRLTHSTVTANADNAMGFGPWVDASLLMSFGHV